MDTAPDLSVIVPVRNEEKNLAPLVRELADALEPTLMQWEIVVVDDASTDGSRELLRGLAATGGRVRVLFLARHFGQSAALEAGFEAARGAYLLPIDADLQNDPADFPDMLRQLNIEKADLVIGWRRYRKDPWPRALASRLANRLISERTKVALHDHGCTMKVIRRDRWEGQKIPDGWHRYLGVLAERRGLVVRERPIGHRPRVHGQSNYGFGRAPLVLRDLPKLAALDREGCHRLKGVPYKIAETLPAA